MSLASSNLYQALRSVFPADLDGTAFEINSGLFYTWSDLERGSAKLANFLQSLDVPPGARVLVQVDPSVEALMLYLASLRIGLVFVPLDMRCQGAEMASVIGEAKPAVVVCSASHFGWISKQAFQAGTAWVFTLHNDRSGSLLERAAQAPDQHSPVASLADDLAVITYTRETTGRVHKVLHTHADQLGQEVLPLPGLGLAAAQVLTRLQAELARTQ
ncbi:AMP-binding protein [Rhodoferax sp. BLA1]|uniref:AMP-binding protein n=1 Tax=Rhodoferax sp. BLA1 TaxID=2576062 RepID=UPI0015D11397|nr:AMP-binding protein [Rhodoferax sp. BLA1]